MILVKIGGRFVNNRGWRVFSTLCPPSASPSLYPMPIYGEASNHRYCLILVCVFFHCFLVDLCFISYVILLQSPCKKYGSNLIFMWKSYKGCDCNFEHSRVWHWTFSRDFRSWGRMVIVVNIQIGYLGNMMLAID